MLQRRLLNNRLAGTVHLLIFYGFIIITLGTIQLILGGLATSLGLPLVGGDPVYQVVVEVQSTVPGDAWASGYTVTYRVAGTTYTVSVLAGLAVVTGDVSGGACRSPESAIAAAWNGS